MESGCGYAQALHCWLKNLVAKELKSLIITPSATHLRDNDELLILHALSVVLFFKGAGCSLILRFWG
jgi:hypothetical protein